MSSYIKGIKINSPPAGEGIPSKKLFFHSCVSSILVKLNLASLKTQQTEYISVIAQPSFPYLFNSHKYKTKTGAMPKLTKSVKESNSFPNSDVPLINLAILPSNASKIAANKIKVTARL